MNYAMTNAAANDLARAAYAASNALSAAYEYANTPHARHAVNMAVAMQADFFESQGLNRDSFLVAVYGDPND